MNEIKVLINANYSAELLLLVRSEKHSFEDAQYQFCILHVC